MPDQCTERFTIAAKGLDDRALGIGVRWALGYARERGQPAAFAVYAVRNCRHLAPILGAGVAAALEHSARVDTQGLDLHLLTEDQLPAAFRGPVLAIWLNDPRLALIDGLGAPAICAIPWSDRTIDGWKALWRPHDLPASRWSNVNDRSHRCSQGSRSR